MLRIAVFASGSGTNAENMVKHFWGSKIATVTLILSNRSDAYVLTRADKLGVPHKIFSRQEFNDPSAFLPILQENKIDFIILAGFLLKCPDYLLEKYPGRILNIHPSLLPKFGGKGMYGEHVHKAVLEAGESVSGITIHTIDDKYDCGITIHQSECTIDDGETPESLAAKVHELEKVYPLVAEEYMKNLF